MKKINLAITGCMGRMGQQIIKSAKSDKNFKLVALTENRIINKKILGIKPSLNTESAFKKVVELEPKNVDAWLDYSNFLFENNSPKKALSTVRKAIQNNQDETELNFKLIAFLIAENKINEATIKLHTILKKDNKVFKKLFEIYPEAKEIQEIVDIIALYKD